MYKLPKYVLYTVLYFTLYNCAIKGNSIKIKQSSNNEAIVIRMNDNINKIIGIKFPFKLNLTNSSHLKKEFTTIDYIYNNKEKGVNIQLFHNFTEISNNQKKTIPSKKEIEFYCLTRHFIDSSQSTQQQFKSYITRMLSENKDTLHIGTVAKFKKEHKNLFEQLTKNDSIAIQFLDGNKFGERVVVPVKW